MSEKPANDPITAKVERLQAYLSPVLDVFNLELLNSTGAWGESFGSESDLRLFLKGVRAGAEMAGAMFKEPEIPMKASVRLDRARSEGDEDDKVPF